MTSNWRMDLGSAGPTVEAIFDAKTGTAEFVNVDERLRGQLQVRTGTFEEITEQYQELTKYAVEKGWLNKGQASHRRGLVRIWYNAEVAYRQRRYGA